MQPLSKEDASIGVRLQDARKDARYTQERLAEKLGISSQQIQKYEKGYNRIGVKSLYKLSVLCDKPLEWFLKDIKSENGASNQFKDSPAARLAQNFNYIKSYKAKIKIYELVEVLMEEY